MSMELSIFSWWLGRIPLLKTQRWKSKETVLQKGIGAWLVGGLEHEFYFPIYWEFHHPNWLSYFSEGWPNHQPDLNMCVSCSKLLFWQGNKSAQWSQVCKALKDCGLFIPCLKPRVWNQPSQKRTEKIRHSQMVPTGPYRVVKKTQVWTGVHPIELDSLHSKNLGSLTPLFLLYMILNRT